MGKDCECERLMSLNHKPSVLILAGWYVPGFKGGGPIRSLVNLVDHLGEKFYFKVITRDRDLGDLQPYEGISLETWQQVGQAQVIYLPRQSLGLRTLTRLVQESAADIVYLNSLFSSAFTIQYLLLRRVGLVRDMPLVLAPRGELSASALTFKALKKRLYLSAAKLLGLYDRVLWQASSDHEAVDIRRCFGNQVPVIVAPNLPSIHKGRKLGVSDEKLPGRLKVLFISRISRMKNLAGALAILPRVKGDIEFHIYGPLEDSEYWAECQFLISAMPPNVKVEYRGAVSHDRIFDIIAEYELFFLPTLGENYGHVIVEALSGGCPVLISDRTPWRNLVTGGVGWDIPLDQPERFEAALQQCLDMDGRTHAKWAQRAQELGSSLQQDQVAVEKSQNLFATAVNVFARA